MRAKLALTENNGREARECYEKAVSIEPALQNEDLLRRIRRLADAARWRPRQPTPQANADKQAGAYYIRNSRKTILTMNPTGMIPKLRSSSYSERM